ncbi:MAG: radical SAM protein, partial [Candidatus Peribacteraceae bacterium]|nr:radical SAM protein [Candidatus Peribacteraceae bacterium]
IIVAIFLAALFAVLIMPFDNPIRRLGKRMLMRFEYWMMARRKGLEAIIPRTSEFAHEKLETLLCSARRGDEILFAARTNVHAIQGFREKIIEALARGVNLKFLLLDMRVLDGEYGRHSMDPQWLGRSVTRSSLAQEISAARHGLEIICQECKSQKHLGRLLVYKTNFSVYNSAVIYEPIEGEGSLPAAILYDISFGNKLEDKFIHYYKDHPTTNLVSFISGLRRFYNSKFAPPIAVFDASLSYVRNTELLQQIVGDRMQCIVKTNPEFEEIRHNPTQSIVPSAISVFHSIKTGVNPPGPISAQIEITNKCSTKCEHCARWSTNDNTHMPIAMVKKLIDQLRSLGVRTVTLSGGEPSQHPDFRSILEYARFGTPSLGVGVLSNGVGLDDNSINAIMDIASWLRLSVDGPDPATYAAVRKSISGGSSTSDFDEIKQLIRRFSGAARQSCQLAICYTIQSSNLGGVREMIDWVNSLGLPRGDKQLVFKFAHGEGQFLCKRDQIDNLLFDPQGVLQNEQYKHSANLPYLRRMIETKFDLIDVASGMPTLSLYSVSPTRCFTPYTFMLIDPRGIVFPCCFLYEDNASYQGEAALKREHHELGKFDTENKNSLAEIWGGSEYKRLRGELSVINPNSERFSSCSRCTRHCNHNVALTAMFDEFASFCEADGNGSLSADDILKDLQTNDNSAGVWL